MNSNENLSFAFGPITVGTEYYQQFAIENLSDVSIQFQWDFVESTLPSCSSEQVCPFTIQPTSGILIGVNKFIVSFSSPHVGFFAYRALLVLKGIPKVSLVSSENDPALTNLKKNGHGKFIPLHGLLHDMCGLNDQSQVMNGTRNQEEAVRLVGCKKNKHCQIDLISLNDIVQLVENNVRGGLEQKYLDEFQIYVFNIIELYISSIEDENEYGQCGHESFTSNKDVLERQISPVYYKSDQKKTPFFFTPTKLSSLRIKSNPASMDYESRIGKSRSEIYKELYLPLNDAVAILGDTICEYLNGEINNDGVDYLQRRNRDNVCGLEISVSGETSASITQFSWIPTKPQKTFDIIPSSIRIEDICVDEEFLLSLKLRNNSDGVTEAYIAEADIDVQIMDPSRKSHFLSIPSFKLQSETIRISLVPLTYESVSLKFLIHSTGSLKINVPIIAFDGAFRKDLVLYLNCVHPLVRFEAPHVDMGLLGVGSDKQLSFNFINESNLRMQYTLQYVVDGDSMVQRYEKNGYFPSSKKQTESYETKTSLSGVELLLEPSSALLDDSKTTSVNVTCFAGLKTGKCRGSLNCMFIGSEPTLFLFSHYLNVVAETQAPIVVLSPSIIYLGDIYVGQSIKFSFTVFSLTDLPSSFMLEICNMEVGNASVLMF